jgi:hypothetical protein
MAWHESFLPSLLFADTRDRNLDCLWLGSALAFESVKRIPHGINSRNIESVDNTYSTAQSDGDDAKGA